MERLNQRKTAYNAIFGSDIFNQLPSKKQTPICNNNNNNNYYEHPSLSSNQMKVSLSSSNFHNERPFSSNHYNYNKANIHPLDGVRTNYSKMLSEFYNVSINNNAKQNSNKNENDFKCHRKKNSAMGTLHNELMESQPFKYPTQTNRIESLKSNIFNDISKEKQNKENNSNFVNIKHNNWNTNLDWKNSKSELVFLQHKPNIHSVNNTKINCKDFKDYYNKKNNNDYQYQNDYMKRNNSSVMNYNLRESSNQTLKNGIDRIQNFSREMLNDVKKANQKIVEFYP
jgi:hypothetical protein